MEVVADEASAASAVRPEPSEDKTAKKSPEAPADTKSVSVGVAEEKKPSVAEVAEFTFVEQEIGEKPISNMDIRMTYSPRDDPNMDDLGSDDEGDGSGENDDSEYSTAAAEPGEVKGRRKGEPSWARKGYKDWDEKEEELLLVALKKYGPRFFGTLITFMRHTGCVYARCSGWEVLISTADEDKLNEAGLGHRPPNAVRAKYRRMWMAGRAPKVRNLRMLDFAVWLCWQRTDAASAAQKHGRKYLPVAASCGVAATPRAAHHAQVSLLALAHSHCQATAAGCRRLLLRGHRSRRRYWRDAQRFPTAYTPAAHCDGAGADAARAAAAATDLLVWSAGDAPLRATRLAFQRTPHWCHASAHAATAAARA